MRDEYTVCVCGAMTIRCACAAPCPRRVPSYRATFGFRKSSASVHGAGGSSRSPAQPSADGGTVTMKRRPATSCGIPTISAKSAFALKIPAKSEWLMYLSSEDGGWEL